MPYLNDLLDNDCKTESIECFEHICELYSLYQQLSNEEQEHFVDKYIEHAKSFSQSHFLKRVFLIPRSRKNTKDSISGKMITHDIVIDYRLSYSNYVDNNKKIYCYFDSDRNYIALKCAEMNLGYVCIPVADEINRFVVNISIPSNDQKQKKYSTEINYESIAENNDSIESIWSSYSDYCVAKNTESYVEEVIEEYFNFSSFTVIRCRFSYEIINIDGAQIEKNIFFYKGENKQKCVEIIYTTRNTNSFNAKLLDKHMNNKINNICEQCIDAGLVFERGELKSSTNSVYSIKIEPRIEE